MKKLRFIVLSVCILVLYLNLERVQAAFNRNVMNVSVLPMEEIETLCMGKEEVFVEPCVTLSDAKTAYDREQNMLLIPQSLQEEYFQGQLSVPEGKLYFLEDAAFGDKTGAIADNQVFRLFWITDTQCWMYNVYFTGMPVLCLTTEAEEHEEKSGTVWLYDQYRPGGSCPDMTCTWHVRGSTTREYEKESYRLTLTEEKFSFLGMRRDDDWILHALYDDDGMIHNKVSYEVWKKIAGSNQVSNDEGLSMEYVELFKDGQYRGVYGLTERIDKKELALNDKDILYKWSQMGAPGEDYYCDGDIEDELLDITRNYSQVEYPRIIEEKKSWPVLYHLSELRENIVDWLPITKDMKVLEVGSGCGAITGALSRKAKEVTCIELSKKRSLINAYRHMECGNVTIHVGNFQDIEPDLPCDYDFICLIGVFEYGQAYIASSDNPYEDYLNILGRHKKTDGHIVIAIENKLGLKYWAGCKEDHLGTWFSSLEGYPDGGVVRTFTRDALMKIAGNCGFSEISMYYPYPDYKFMTSLYSDARLPKAGELSSNLRNFDRERLLLFDEKLVFDTLISEGQFPLFSNSYMMVLGPQMSIKYAKYSNDRANEYKIKTTLNHCETAGKTVKKIEKHALSNESQEHIVQINKGYEKLLERFAGSKLKINKCTLVSPEKEISPAEPENSTQSVYAEFEYLEGRTLEEHLDECLEKDDLDKFHMLFDEYLERISYNEGLPVADYDLIFSNILISPDGAWNIIDYEWTFDKQVDTRELAFRAVYCYLLENEKRNKLNLDLILQKLGITEENAAFYRQQEMRFQKYVTGKRMSMPEIRDAIGQPVYSISELPMLTPMEKQKGMIQIYEDMGSGFLEEHSFFLEDDRIENEEFKLVVEEGRKALRIDPCSDYCIVRLKEIKWNETTLTPKSKCITTNGFRIGDGVYGFDTQDPNITVQLSSLGKKRENILRASMQVTRVPEETIKHMQKRGLF